MEGVLPYIVGAAVVILLMRAGVRIPFIEIPHDGKLNSQASTKTAGEVLTWVMQVRSGDIRLNDQDKEILKLIKSALVESEK